MKSDQTVPERKPPGVRTQNCLPCFCPLPYTSSSARARWPDLVLRRQESGVRSPFIDSPALELADNIIGKGASVSGISSFHDAPNTGGNIDLQRDTLRTGPKTGPRTKHSKLPVTSPTGIFQRPCPRRNGLSDHNCSLNQL